MNQVHWITVKSVPDKDALTIERWQSLHGGHTKMRGQPHGVIQGGNRVYTAPVDGTSTDAFPFSLRRAAATAAPTQTAASAGATTWDWTRTHPAAVTTSKTPQPQRPLVPSPAALPAPSPFPVSHASPPPSSLAVSLASTHVAPVASVPPVAPVAPPLAPPPVPVVLSAGKQAAARATTPAATTAKKRGSGRSRSPRKASKSPKRARSPRSPKRGKSKSRSPRAARGLRHFYQTNQHGRRMSSSAQYTLHSDGAPIDVVKQIIQAQLDKGFRGARGQRTNEDVVLVPASVEKAVEQAVRQNFMCTCAHGASHCTDAAACRQRSRKHGSMYLNKYMRDAPRIFVDSITIYLREHGKQSVREYAGGYRLINNPSKLCIKQGVNKEVVARYVASHKVDEEDEPL